jgi:ketosteroid isomerase-like protein
MPEEFEPEEFEKNVEVARSSFEAHSSGGIEAALRFYAADMVWYTGPGWIEDDVYRGHDGARRVDAVFSDSFEDYALELHEIRAVGERVLALFEATGRMKGSGAPVHQRVGLVMAGFRDGTIGEVRSFFSWTEALRAVGVEE